MRLLIHDLSAEAFAEAFPALPENVTIIADDGTIRLCIGCFGCWVRTPGVCVIPDQYQNMGQRLAAAEAVTIISRCCYGGFSPFVKNVLDRSIAYVHPDFEMRNGEMHHKKRYDHPIRLKVWFYGDGITAGEQQTARQLLLANTINLAGRGSEAVFVKEPRDITSCIESELFFGTGDSG